MILTSDVTFEICLIVLLISSNLIFSLELKATKFPDDEKAYPCTLECFTNRTEEFWTVKWDDGHVENICDHPPTDFVEVLEEPVIFQIFHI